MQTIVSAASAGQSRARRAYPRNTPARPRATEDGPLALSAWAFDPRLDPLARLVALTISLHIDADGRAWPSVRRLAELTGLDPRTVADRVQHMIALGLLADDGERRGRGVRVVRVVGFRPASWQRPSAPARTDAPRVQQSAAEPARTTAASNPATAASKGATAASRMHTNREQEHLEKDAGDQTAEHPTRSELVKTRLAEARLRMIGAMASAPHALQGGRRVLS